MNKKRPAFERETREAKVSQTTDSAMYAGEGAALGLATYGNCHGRRQY